MRDTSKGNFNHTSYEPYPNTLSKSTSRYSGHFLAA